MSENFLNEAFKDLKILNEETFPFDKKGAEELKIFLDGDISDDFKDIIDPEAKEPEDLKDSYVGKAILCCDVCHSLIYKDPEDIHIDEESEEVNVDEECPYCYSKDGFKVVGQVSEFKKEEVEEKPESEESKEVEEKEEIEFEESLKNKRSFLKESSKRDDIDADADDKKEKAEKNLEKEKDDADSDKDYHLKKDDMKEPDQLKEESNIEKLKKAHPELDIDEKLTESDEPAALSIEDCQKYVDYDMKHYGKISDKTNEIVRKAGFQIIKDQYGDYEVAVGKYESLKEDLNPESLEKELRKAISDFFFNEGSKKYKEKADQAIIEIEPIEEGYFIRLKVKTTYDYLEDLVGELRPIINRYDKNSFFDPATGGLATAVIRINKKNESLKEDLKKVEIETDTEKMSMTSEEDGKTVVVTEPKKVEEEVKEEEEVIAPVSDEMKAEIEEPAEEETIEDEEKIDIDEFDEESFDELGENYLKKVYDNVDEYKTTSAKIKDNKLMLEGVIKFNSGKEAKTSFLFESSRKTAKGKVKFIGSNKQITESTNSFIITGSIDNKKLLSESLTYNYKVKGEKDRVYGTIKK